MTTKRDDGLTPQQRWSAKNGYVSKSFRMYQSVADDFRAACEKAGRTQGSVIQELMLGFIDSQNGKDTGS